MKNYKLFDLLEKRDILVKNVAKFGYQHLGYKLSNDKVTELELAGVRLNDEELESLEEFSELKHLNLNRNDLEQVPKVLDSLTSLCSIHLAGNKIKSLDSFRHPFPKIKFLVLGNNFLDSFELAKKLKLFPALKELYLNDLDLNVFPETIFDLQNLEILALYSNQIKIIPEEIIKLKNLRALTMGSNFIQVLPDCLYDLSCLEELSLYKNKIKCVSSRISNLKNLQELNLYGNQLKNLPEEIGACFRLKFITLAGNHLRKIPDSLFKINFNSLNLTKNPELNFTLFQKKMIKNLVLKKRCIL